MYSIIAIGVLIVFTVGMFLTEALDYQEREAIEEIKKGKP